MNTKTKRNGNTPRKANAGDETTKGQGAFPLDYDREAAQLAAYMASDETPEAVKTLIIDYLNELSSATDVGVWTPAVLRVAFPIMRYRDGASEGARVLLGYAIDAVTDEAGRAKLREIWEAERARFNAPVAQKGGAR